MIPSSGIGYSDFVCCSFNVCWAKTVYIRVYDLQSKFLLVFSPENSMVYITGMEINISVHREELISSIPSENAIINSGKIRQTVCSYNMCKNKKSYSILTPIMQIYYPDIINIKKIPLVLIPMTGTDNPHFQGVAHTLTRGHVTNTSSCLLCTLCWGWCHW